MLDVDDSGLSRAPEGLTVVIDTLQHAIVEQLMPPVETAKAKSRLPRADVPIHDRISLSVEEAAGLTGIGRTKIYMALRDGEIPRIRIGKRTLVKVADLNAWLTKNTTDKN